MYLIGESLNVISKKIGTAFKERDPKPIQEEALFQKEKGMDYIDINLGPAKKDGHELMPWVVQTVQEVVSDVPLALDTSNIDAIEAALKVYKETPQPPLINSIMVRPERYERMVPLAAEHNADFIALMWGPEGLPRDCGRPMAGRSWHSYIGHLGLHGLADNYFNGDVTACQRRLRRNGIARQDPFPSNNAYPSYQPITKCPSTATGAKGDDNAPPT